MGKTEGNIARLLSEVFESKRLAKKEISRNPCQLQQMQVPRIEFAKCM